MQEPSSFQNKAVEKYIFICKKIQSRFFSRNATLLFKNFPFSLPLFYILLILCFMFHYIVWIRNFRFYVSSKRSKRLRAVFRCCGSIDMNTCERSSPLWISMTISWMLEGQSRWTNKFNTLVSIVSVCVAQRDATHTSRCPLLCVNSTVLRVKTIRM